MIVVTVADAAGNVSSCTSTFSVVDKTPPIVTCPAAATVAADAGCKAAVPNFLANLAASDNCTPAGQLVKTQNPAAGTLLGLGAYSVRLTVTDAAGNSAACTVGLRVVDSTAPLIQSVTATPNRISQRNHQMVPVTVNVPVVADAYVYAPQAGVPPAGTEGTLDTNGPALWPKPLTAAEVRSVRAAGSDPMWAE